MHIFNNKSSLIKAAQFPTPDWAAKGPVGSGKYSVGSEGWRTQTTPTYNATIPSITGNFKVNRAEGSTNFNSNYNNPNINIKKRNIIQDTLNNISKKTILPHTQFQ